VSPAKNVYVSSAYVKDSIQTIVYNLKIDMLDGNAPVAYQSFCIDLKQLSSTSFQPYEVATLGTAPLDGGSPYSPMGDDKANAIRELWGEHFTEATTSALNAAAFQTAIWEIIYENSNTDQTINAWDAATGRFKIISSTVSALANEWLGAIGDESRTLDTTLMAVVNHTTATKYQDYVISMEFGGFVIPEPITLLSAVVGLCGLGAYVRRRVQ